VCIGKRTAGLSAILGATAPHNKELKLTKPGKLRSFAVSLVMEIEGKPPSFCSRNLRGAISYPDRRKHQSAQLFRGSRSRACGTLVASWSTDASSSPPKAASSMRRHRIS